MTVANPGRVPGADSVGQGGGGGTNSLARRATRPPPGDTELSASGALLNASPKYKTKATKTAKDTTQRVAGESKNMERLLLTTCPRKGRQDRIEAYHPQFPS